MSYEDLKSIQYINLPKNAEKAIGNFKIDSSIQIPIQTKDGQTKINPSNITIEAIIAGMLIIIAYQKEHKHFDYYKNFVLAVQGNTISELNAAAIAKEKQKDYPFAEQLFLTVYHMLPQAASCINLATLYSSWSVNEKKNKDETKEELYLSKALNTLQEGLELFGENADILGELGAFHTYLGNLEEAEDYLTSYLKIAEESEKKEKFRQMLKDVKIKLSSDIEIKQAYDYMQLNEEEKALESIEKFLAKNKNIWHGHFIKGWALRKLKRYSEAENEFLKCLELKESNFEIYNELSICALESGNRELAKQYLNISLDIEATLTSMNNLAFLHMLDKEFDEAKFYLEKARLINNEDKHLKIMLDEYTKLTGEEFGPLIVEEFVNTQNKDKK